MSDEYVIDIDRVFEEEEELRRVAPEEGAHGRNSSDYRNMYDLFLNVVETAKSLRADPQAFVTKSGQYNDKIMNAWTKMVSVAKGCISELNKMRNADRMVGYILDKHTHNISVSVSGQVSHALEELIEALEQGEDPQEVIHKARVFQKIKLPDIFVKTAQESLNSTKEEFSLLH